MIRKSMKAWLALLFFAAAGCSAIQDHCINFETSTRNCVLAEKGWMRWASCYKGMDNKMHFAKGFKEGYQNILEGGKGCQPTLPPRWYWKPCYQSAAGGFKIAAWFDGFTHGAVAAQQDGFGNMQQLPISPTAKANWMTRQAPPAAACFAGMSEGNKSDPVTTSEIRDAGIPEEPPKELRLKPEVEMESGAESEIPVRPYDDSGSTR